MYLMFYVNEKEERVYTLKVRWLRAAVGPMHALAHGLWRPHPRITTATQARAHAAVVIAAAAAPQRSLRLSLLAVASPAEVCPRWHTH